MTELKLGWCSREAAAYAVMHWHYSKRMPAAILAKIGVWENGQFVGAVMFGTGANSGLLRPYGLSQTEGCELVRVALRKHESPVTRILAQSIAMLRARYPKLRLIVSFADPEQGHIGTIYQAGNWYYSGCSDAADEYLINGKRWHGRTVRSKKPAHLTTKQFATMLDPNVQVAKGSSKHRYLYPLDRKMRKQIESLSKPYPKRVFCGGSVESDTSVDQTEEAGATPAPRPRE